MRKVLSNVGLMVVLVLAAAGAASASPIGPYYPPPGGVTLSPAAGTNVGSVGGRTFAFTGLDPLAYTDLYWGLGGTATASLDGSPDPLVYSSFNGVDIVTFTGSTVYSPCCSGSYVVPIKMEIKLISGGTWVTAASLGLSPTLGYLVDVSGTAFTTNVSVFANIGSGFQAINTVSPGPTQSSFTGGFYYVPDAGGTLGLLSLAVAGLATVKRRFRA